MCSSIDCLIFIDSPLIGSSALLPERISLSGMKIPLFYVYFRGNVFLQCRTNTYIILVICIHVFLNLYLLFHDCLCLHNLHIGKPWYGYVVQAIDIIVYAVWISQFFVIFTSRGRLVYVQILIIFLSTQLDPLSQLHFHQLIHTKAIDNDFRSFWGL